MDNEFKIHHGTGMMWSE